MKIYLHAVLILSLSSVLQSFALNISKEQISEAAKKCKTRIDFDTVLATDNGSTCKTCKFCRGSSLKSLCDSKAENTCIVCSDTSDKCNYVSFITNFGKSWSILFFDLTTSNKETVYDPHHVVIKAGTSANDEVAIYDSNDVADLLVQEHGAKVYQLLKMITFFLLLMMKLFFLTFFSNPPLLKLIAN